MSIFPVHGRTFFFTLVALRIFLWWSSPDVVLSRIPLGRTRPVGCFGVAPLHRPEGGKRIAEEWPAPERFSLLRVG